MRYKLYLLCKDSHMTSISNRLIIKNIEKKYFELQMQRQQRLRDARIICPPQLPFFDHFWPFYRQLPLYLSQNWDSLKKGAGNTRPWSSHLFSGDYLLQCPRFTVKRWPWFGATNVMLALALGVVNVTSMTIYVCTSISWNFSLRRWSLIKLYLL